MNSFLVLFLISAIIAGIAIGTFCIYQAIILAKYNKTTYKKITHNSYSTMREDKGKEGEYEIYQNLRRFEAQGCKFLFNLYLPKSDGKTTEIDVLMICSDGIFVFESKNYSGWIFGNETQKMWTQTLRARGGGSQKEHFYNPIWQNRSHCLALQELLPQNVAIHSVVLFSDRCSLMRITVKSTDVVVAHRGEACAVVAFYLQQPTQEKIDVNLLYDRLYPYSQVPETVKQAHINEVDSRNRAQARETVGFLEGDGS